MEGTKFFHAKPAFELMLKDEPSVPTIALSWSTFGGGAKIASVAASGQHAQIGKQIVNEFLLFNFINF